MHIFKVKLLFYPPCEVKCELQNRVLTPLYLQFFLYTKKLAFESSNSVKHFFMFRPQILNYNLINFNLNTLDAEYT